MKISPRFLIPILILVFAILACGAPASVLQKFEKGDITFVNPAADGSTVFHNYGVTVLPVEITINSTFDDPKVARISVDGVPWIDCSLEGDGYNTSCPTASIQVTGMHTISAEVRKLDNSLVSAQTSINWAPYSPLEQSMQKVAGMVGQNDPIWGFNLVSLLITVAASLALAAATKGSNFWYYGVSAVLVGGLFFVAPPAVIEIVTRSIGGVITGYLLITLLKGTNIFFVHRGSDGSGTILYAGPGGESGGRITDSVGKNAGQLMGPPPQQQQYRPQLPYQDQYGIVHEEIQDNSMVGRIFRGIRGK